MHDVGLCFYIFLRLGKGTRGDRRANWIGTHYHRYHRYPVIIFFRLSHGSWILHRSKKICLLNPIPYFEARKFKLNIQYPTYAREARAGRGGGGEGEWAVYSARYGYNRPIKARTRLCEMIDDRPIYLRRQTNTTNNLQKKLRGASALEMTDKIISILAT
ncbi:uncharacterized protein LAJ45_05378 [Morchella importuna]|uniref:uncharacterized protein n=1 Tax=Morchella importuna TaxID=1174673 RepID=UPI001E8DB52E|nr:uncharacterized protein LAJ45_05378 [Morchella importuna]KAH8150682.1 hypothetical protein LAJ45_05378 [Morchella importuna]